MEPEEPLLSSPSHQEAFNLTVKANGQSSELRITEEAITVGEIKVMLDDAIGLITDSIQEDKSRAYSLYSYPRRKKWFKSVRRYIERV